MSNRLGAAVPRSVSPAAGQSGLAFPPEDGNTAPQLRNRAQRARELSDTALALCAFGCTASGIALCTVTPALHGTGVPARVIFAAHLLIAVCSFGIVALIAKRLLATPQE